MKPSECNSEYLQQSIQMQLSKKNKLFLNFLLNFWNLFQILNILKKNMTLIDYVFPNLQTAKDLLRAMSKNRRFRTHFDSQCVKGFQTYVKSAWQHFHHTFSSLRAKLTWKMSLIVISEIVGLFVKTLTADDEYSLRSSGILLQPIQMQLSKKQVNFFKFFTQFLRSTSIYEHFQIKRWPS